MGLENIGLDPEIVDDQRKFHWKMWAWETPTCTHYYRLEEDKRRIVKQKTRKIQRKIESRLR